MNTVKALATAGLLFLAVWLCLEVARAMRERTAHQSDASARKSELETLRTQLETAKAERAAAAKLELAAAAASAAAQDAAAIPAAPDPVDRRIADREQEFSRRNDLHRYVVGLERLRLPPPLLAQAKAIILARPQAPQTVEKRVYAVPEILADYNRRNQVMEDQLTALLGAAATLELRSAARESSIDWTLGTDLWDAGTPLTSEQLRALARVDVAARPSETHRAWETTDDPPDSHTGLSRQNVDYLAATARVLSTEQQAALQRSLIEDNRYNAAMQAFGKKQKQLSGSR